MSHDKATRGSLAMDLVILNHGQVTMTTPEFEVPSPNFHTIPTEGRLSLDRFNAHQFPLHGGSASVLGSNPRHANHESVSEYYRRTFQLHKSFWRRTSSFCTMIK
ncbi:hypothetical protein TNCV_4273121 [Trichonephila clavipes]|nr:hypothetical protein TNCV_4273121 [Trichonephila clavipes]